MKNRLNLIGIAIILSLALCSCKSTADITSSGGKDFSSAIPVSADSSAVSSDTENANAENTSTESTPVNTVSSVSQAPNTSVVISTTPPPRKMNLLRHSLPTVTKQQFTRK